MKYVTYVNGLIRQEIGKFEEFVVYGQNVSRGSCLGGLARGLEEQEGCAVFNVPNTENALVGMGFGLMLSGVSSIFFMKQQDFLLLGIDQITNTNNFARQQPQLASFTIVNITVDSGFEGFQSSLNNLPDFCAISNCKGYAISSKQDAELVIGRCIPEPGFRIISVSQRLMGTEILDFQGAPVSIDDCIIKYAQGDVVTIACANFSLPQGKQLRDRLVEVGRDASLFGITAAHPCPNKPIIDDAKRTGRLVIIDDSKSQLPATRLLEVEALRAGVGMVHIVKRDLTEDSYRPHSEIFDVDINDVIRRL